MRLAITMGLGLLTLFAGCAREGAAPPGDHIEYYQTPREAAPAMLLVDAPAGVALDPTGSAGGLPWRAPAAAGAMLVRVAQAVIAVDSLEPAVTAVHRLADRLGGIVAGSRLDTGTRQRRSASLELRIPADRFDDALGSLRPIGRLESVNVSAQDVGEEFVDVNARIDNARRLEQRLLALLSSRTAKLKDVLEVEQALARVRQDIERYEGRTRYLREHTATSTITVTLQEPAPLVGPVGTSVMGEAGKRAWRNFVTLAALFVASLGVTLPVGLVAAGVWLGVRRRRPRAAAVAH